MTGRPQALCRRPTLCDDGCCCVVCGDREPFCEGTDAGRSRTCSAEISSFRDDDYRWPCGDAATREVLAASGQWEPWCEYHVHWRGIPASRVRVPADAKCRIDRWCHTHERWASGDSTGESCTAPTANARPTP